MPEMNEVPVIALVGSEGWRNAYETGDELEKLWPGQDAYDFCYAVEYNDVGPLEGRKIAGLLMVQQGANDEGSWVWLVKLDDGSHHWMEGSCDYTGWDCQSGNEWQSYEEGVVPTPMYG